MTDNYSETILSDYLLVFANYLRFLRINHLKRSVSNEIQQRIKMLSDRSSSSIISARARWCWIFLHFDEDSSTISDWINKIWVTSDDEVEYNLLIQGTLFEDNWMKISFGSNLVNLLLDHSKDFLPKFINELYDDLCQKNSNTGIFDLTPNYIDVAVQLIEENPNLFCDAIQQSIYGDKKFKETLCHVSQRGNNEFHRNCVRLYAVFGELTSDLLNMLLDMKRLVYLDKMRFDYFNSPINPIYRKHLNINDQWDHLKFIKTFSWDRDMIENLFTALDHHPTSILIIRLLKKLVESNDASLLEIHKNVSEAIRKIPSSQLNQLENEYTDLIELLEDLSCIKTETHIKDMPVFELMVDNDQNSTKIFFDQDILTDFEMANRPFDDIYLIPNTTNELL